MGRLAWKLLISGLILLLAGLAWRGDLDTLGHEYTQAGLTRALITFGVARGLNGVISVAQGTEVAIEPAGVGVTLAPGQILDPLNDLVERFSWIMLASATSLGIQQMLLTIMAWPGLTLLLAGLLVATLALLWWPRPVSTGLRAAVYRSVLIALILRFTIPLIAIGNELLYDAFLEPQYAASQAHLKRSAEVIDAANQPPEAIAATPPSPPSFSTWLEGARRAYDSAAEAMNVERRLGDFTRAAADISKHAINLIVVFVLQTILLPLLYLWLMAQAIKAVFRARFSPQPRA
ncbi:MAG: hypothetical protein ABR553_06895 [Gammaproteobacteria bacterium]